MSPAAALPLDIAEPAGRWRVLGVLSIGILLAEAPWFTSPAVAPLLREAWHPEGLELALLVVAVQLGFAAAAILFAVSRAADVIRSDRLFFSVRPATYLPSRGVHG